MEALLNLTIGIVLLYVVYKVVGGVVLPMVNERRLRRYKEDFYRRNPQVDREKMEQREQERKERESIIDQRKRLRR